MPIFSVRSDDVVYADDHRRGLCRRLDRLALDRSGIEDAVLDGVADVAGSTGRDDARDALVLVARAQFDEGVDGVHPRVLREGPRQRLDGVGVRFDRELFSTLDSGGFGPDAMGDGAIAMGATEWQTMKSISIPAAFSGISAAIILGLGRAIGETMAVAAIMAAGVGLADPLFDFFDASATLTSLIAVNYGSASESTLDVLFVAGVMLFVIVAGMSIVSQYIERQMKQKLKGQS